jgi:sensor histidine kinase YesM
MNVRLIKKGDSLDLKQPPNVINEYSFSNLRSGSYTLYVQIFQADGSISLHRFPITIKKFLYQQWWFWPLLSILIISSIGYLLNLNQKKQVADEKAKRKEAELLSYKNEQEKKMANLRLLSLSSQFRPHFILNALNTIGAQMEDKPETETVLSRLGESVNLIFNHATQQKTMHPFTNEWQLVTNIIDIHRLMYLKELEADLPAVEKIKHAATLQVPMGILQIPIENSLLHGLSNRDGGPWKLEVSINKLTLGLEIIITDNGVGRKKSASLSNHTKHGTGTKNLNEIIDIINAANEQKITVEYEDDIFIDGSIKYGTVVKIFIPDNIKYDG